jgi:hypothetical protein
MTHAHPHDALADTLPFVMPDPSSCTTASPAVWVWPAAVLEPAVPAWSRRAWERWHAGAMIAALLEPSGAR